MFGKVKLPIITLVICLGMSNSLSQGGITLSGYGSIGAGDVYDVVQVIDPMDPNGPMMTLVTMTGGQVGELMIYGMSTVDIEGGEILGNTLKAFEHSTANLKGGIIGALEAYDNATIIVYGKNLFWDDINGTLSGRWLDGTSFSIPVTTPETMSHVVLIPEPATLCVLGLGGLALLRRKGF